LPNDAGIVAGSIGGLINPVYGYREPMTYPVMEHEFRMLSSQSAFSAVFFSVGSFLLSAFLGVLVNYIFASQPRSSFGIALFYFSWTFLGLAIGSFVIGSMFVRSRNSLEEQIKKQTRLPGTAST
jgi:hypothetical protein